jgi:RimJ/RimL family protein N-acetyltransferase
MSIKGKIVTLRAIEREDLSVLHKWANDPEINAMIGGWHFPSSINDQQKWFETLNLNSLNQRYAIEVADAGLIGTANLVDINWKDKNAHHGIAIGDRDARGKGYAVDTIMAIMRFAFEELGLNRLDTTIIEYNASSIGVYTKKCGWAIEGTQKKWYFRKNQYWDRHIVGITGEQYFDLINKNNYWNEQ